MLGVGIFLAPAIIAEHAASATTYMLYWLLGGLIALAGAASFAELGTMMPRSGGEYAFLQRAFGNSVAVAAGWTLVLIVFPGSIASMVAALTQYQILPWANVLLQTDFTHEGSAAKFVNVTLILILTLLNLAGANLSARAQTVVVTLPLVILTILALFGLCLAPESAETSAKVLHPSGSGLTVFSLAFMATYYTYSGWNAVGYVAGEVQNPSRNVPRALIGGTLIVTSIYVLLAWFFVQTLGITGLRNSPEAGSASVGAWIGVSAGAWMSIPIALGVLASTNSSVLGGARISFALAEDGLLPKSFKEISASGKVPAFALWVQALVSIILVITGTFNELLMLTSLTMLLIGAAAVAALIYLRRKEPTTPRPFKVPFYPLTPAIYLTGCGVVIFSQCLSAMRTLFDPYNATKSDTYILGGLIAFVTIIVVHALWQRFKRHDSLAD